MITAFNFAILKYASDTNLHGAHKMPMLMAMQAMAMPWFCLRQFCYVYQLAYKKATMCVIHAEYYRDQHCYNTAYRDSCSSSFCATTSVLLQLVTGRKHCSVRLTSGEAIAALSVRMREELPPAGKQQASI